MERPDGVRWGCDVCPIASGSTGGGADGSGSFLADVRWSAELCATCRGYPVGHPECLGVRFRQTFNSVPHAMWFTIVTVTTTGFGDVYPETSPGKTFVSAVILMGVVFLAVSAFISSMHLSIVT